jgi:cysteinyl-tRNA synthetase
LSEEKLAQVDEYRQQFLSALTNDMQIPQAVAVMWQMLKSNIPSEDKLDLLLELDQILGLKLSEVFEEVIPQEIIDLAIQRQQARDKKNFEKSDELKKIIQNKGYDIEDNQAGYKIKKTS